MYGEPYGALLQFIQFVENEMNVSISVKDYVGFIRTNDDLRKALSEHMVHGNPYCMYIKSVKENHRQCMYLMENVVTQSMQENGICYGICHAGVKECIARVWYECRPVGSVHAGVFSTDPECAHRCIHTVCERSGLDENTAKALYERSLNHTQTDWERLEIYLNMIAEMLSTIFASQSLYGKYGHTRPTTVMSHNDIVYEAIKYLKDHMREHVVVREVAEHCHCSVSCLSHLFKNSVGMSVPSYLMKLRIDQALDELENTQKSIATVAVDVGFSDPNYFARVFQRQTGQAPTWYRKRLSKIK